MQLEFELTWGWTMWGMPLSIVIGFEDCQDAIDATRKRLEKMDMVPDMSPSCRRMACTSPCILVFVRQWKWGPFFGSKHVQLEVSYAD